MHLLVSVQPNLSNFEERKSMRKRIFYIAWIVSSTIMFLLSYLWHGLILNDLKNLQYPLEMFMLLATLLYIVLGFGLAFLYNYLNFSRNIKFKGSILGSFTGFFVYLIAFTLGVSFGSSKMEHVVVDFIWQMIEQGIGGLAVSAVFSFSAYLKKAIH
jgi:membrane protease YdiL (CAAX protease family)